jgi:hypothetical protein
LFRRYPPRFDFCRSVALRVHALLALIPRCLESSTPIVLALLAPRVAVIARLFTRR